MMIYKLEFHIKSLKHEVYLRNLNKIDLIEYSHGQRRRKRPDSGDIDLLLKAGSKKTYNKFIDLSSRIILLSIR